MSQSSSTSKCPDERRQPVGRWVLFGFVAVFFAIVIGVSLYRGHIASVHADRGERILAYGREFADVLESYGPIAPIEVLVGEDRVSDLYDDDTDPTRRWGYSGSAYFSVDPQQSQLTPEAAYKALCDYFVSQGWEPGRGGIGPDRVVFYREDDLGSWRVEVLGPDDSYQGVTYMIQSDSAGGGVA